MPMADPTPESVIEGAFQKIRELLAFYRPDVLVLENCQGRGSRRAKRIQTLINLMTAHAAEERIAIASFSRSEVRACFSSTGSTTKRRIAESIAREFPELEPRLPPVRRIWMSEDSRMSIFDAAALGMTYFHTGSRLKRAAAFATCQPLHEASSRPARD
jgi:Holliday junction resolvasome RuvABC endonuclease subunit